MESVIFMQKKSGHIDGRIFFGFKWKELKYPYLY